MSGCKIISVPRELNKLRFVGDRTPRSTAEQLEGAFSELASYRDGSVFIGCYAGQS